MAKLTEEQRYKNQLAASRKWKVSNKEKNRRIQQEWNNENKAKRQELKKAWDLANVEHRKSYAAKRKEKDPTYTVRKHLKDAYGMELSEYDALLNSQSSGCAICGKLGGSSTWTKLAVDHCHKTGAVRALLCRKCNTALGMVNDDIGVLTAMISYLMEHSA